MALKKSALYSKLWASCDLLRGGMDASQYKDYVLAMLFIKYVSDRYAGEDYAPIEIPKGATFADMVALKGQPDIGDQINKKIIAPLKEASQLSEMPDFNDTNKLGSGKEMVERLTKLIGIFEDASLNFSTNRAGDDDLLGDAYEYLIRNFATQSGKSKGQFYTPAEVSRVIAQILGVRTAKTSPSTTVYDPTCGSGSLLLKVADEASTELTLYGQESDSTTSGLARMNMILHDNAGASIAQGNTLTDPKFKDGADLKQFDYVVANPPFSDKRWSTGLDLSNDPHNQFLYGAPPPKQGDYAYLLHILRSLKSTGKGACILPHGVLFRGNAEAGIRKNLVQNGFIKGIIGLPANLFFGTGIPACIIVLDKEHAHTRKGIFLIDASAGFMKDGPKNRLRDQDIHRIVNVFTKQIDVPRFARMVSLTEIEKNDFNLNLPRYIDSQVAEDIQDIAAHLQGGIPVRDVDALQSYWEVCPKLRASLFSELREGYLKLNIEKSAIKTTILEHPEFKAFTKQMNDHFESWRSKAVKSLKDLTSETKPKQTITELSDGLLAHYLKKPLIDPYDVYQHLRDYWAESMQDDCYIIVTGGWVKGAMPREILKVKDKNDKLVWPEEHDYLKGKQRFKSDLIPATILVARYFEEERQAIEALDVELATLEQQLGEMREENGGEEGLFAEVIEVDGDTQKITAKAVKDRLKEIADDENFADERTSLQAYQNLLTRQENAKDRNKKAVKELDAKIDTKYPTLTEDEIKVLVVEDKWLATLDGRIHAELDRVSQQLTTRVKELAERYETDLPTLTDHVAELEAKVNGHLQRMGFIWN